MSGSHWFTLGFATIGWLIHPEAHPAATCGPTDPILGARAPVRIRALPPTVQALPPASQVITDIGYIVG